MESRLKDELRLPAKWERLIYIRLRGDVSDREVVITVTVVLQFLVTLITGTFNSTLRVFGHRLRQWIREAVDYYNWASDVRPWPFGNPWPQPPALPMRRPDARPRV